MSQRTTSVFGERMARVQLIQLEVHRLRTEADMCKDPDRLTAIRQEMEILYNSMVEIRREQLREQIEGPARPSWTRRPWWRFWG